MHSQDLKDAIFMSIFDDEEVYRKHYVPTVRHLRKNPEDKSRIQELVDNATMRFCKANKMDYKNIPAEAKQELTADIYNEIVDNEIKRSR